MFLLSALIPIAITLLGVKAFMLFYAYLQRMKYVNKFPGPKGYPLIGNSLEFKNHKDILPTALKYMKQYGLTFHVQLGGHHVLFTGDPKLNEFITTSNTQLKKSLQLDFMKHWLGDGLVTADIEKWRRHRRLITPTFHFKILEDFVPIFNKNTKNLIQHLTSKRLNQVFDIYEDVLLCSLDTICETAMRISINALNDGNQSNYVQSIKSMGQSMMSRAFSFWKRFDFLYKLSSDYKTEVEMVKYIKGITEHVIKTRQEALMNQKQNENQDGDLDEFGMKRRTVFLDHLLTTNMNDEELREEVDTFIFAGHDTVSSAISFTLYYLAKHQDVQQKTYDEVMSVLDGDNEMSFEKLPELKYMERVIKETLRLCPSVPLHARVMTEDVVFEGKVIPKGVSVALFVYGSHRNEQLFENPEEFNPDRFLDEDFVKNTLFAYLPFNAGPRNCIGQRYAMIIMKCMLSLLVKEFRFAKKDDFFIHPVTEGVLKSENGVMLTLEKRQHKCKYAHE